MFGPRLEKILEVGRRIHQHLARSVDAVQVVAPARLHRFHPVGKIGELLFRALREQVGGEPHGELIVLVQLGDGPGNPAGSSGQPPPASITLVTPSRFSSRMNCRVELSCCSYGSFGPLASVE